MGFILPNGGGGSNGGASGKVPTPPTGGGSQGSGSGGAGSVGAVNLALLPVTGGLVGYQVNMLYPIFDQLSGNNMIYLMDSNNFNTEEDVEYDFRVEEFEPGNEATIHRIVIRYRDLGVVTFTVAVVSATTIAKGIDTTIGSGNARVYTVGNQVPTDKIYTLLVALKVTTEAPQIKVFRKANAGPLDITKVKVWASYGDGDII